MSKNGPREVVTQGRLEPPLVLGPERLHYQYAVTVPQLHMTLISVMQGLAFGVLLLNIPLPSPADQENVIQWILNQHLFIPFIISSLMVIFIWMQFVSTNLFLIWPVSTFQTILVFLLTVAEVITFRVAASVPAWLIGSGVITCVGGVIYLNNLRLGTQDDFEDEGAKRAEVSSNTLSGLGYVGLGIIVMATGLIQSGVARNVSWLFYFSNPVLTWGELIVLLLLMFALILWDATNRQHVLKQIARGSDLVVMAHGKIRYREPNGA